ncbi:MAG: serine/threonine-protein kinase [Proteobacteria bacterium]|nr:serine/threonine-protein kinase [Pseudomonadota bacterium]
MCPACKATSDGASGRFCPICGAPFATGTIQGMSGIAALTAQLQPSSESTNLIGTTIDGFQIDEILGGGAFGTVYRGRQLGLERPVAFKVPTVEMAGDPITARRFAREARSAARVDHPGVVTIYGVGELPDGRPYLAMQLVDGRPLDHIFALDGGPPVPLSVMRALEIARQIASALSETHANDVVHRDLKPSNIIWRLDRNGDDRITLVDFGIAVCKPGGAEATRLTGGNLIGTPHYMSPEKAHGEEVDGRADLYALGCILFELLTCRTPFLGTGFEVLLAHLGRPIPAPSDHAHDIPPVVDVLVMKLLAKKPDQRPQTGDEVVAMIDAALAALGAAVIATRTPSRRSFARPALLGLVVIGVLSAAGFAAVKLRTRPPGTLEGIAGSALEDDADAKRREIVADDGTFVARISLPDVIRAKTPVRARITILTKLGTTLDAGELVVTVEDGKGGASGFPARRRDRDGEKFFGFRHTFPEPGHYILHIFPPESDSEFRVELDVE